MIYLKIDEYGQILGHDCSSHDDYNIEIENIDIFDSEYKVYKFKYIDNKLIELTLEEKLNHPLKLINIKLKRMDEIKVRLNQIDFESIRAIRAINNSSPLPADIEKLSELELEAQNLRLEFQQLL